MSKQYTMDEVKKHNKAEDLWVVIEGKVYDLTKYLKDVRNLVYHSNPLK